MTEVLMVDSVDEKCGRGEWMHVSYVTASLRSASWILSFSVSSFSSRVEDVMETLCPGSTNSLSSAAFVIIIIIHNRSAAND
jgi:hypothetical protein